MAFKVADDNGRSSLNLADLRAMLQFLGDNAAQVPHAVRQCLGREHRRDPARRCCSSRSKAAEVLRRTDARDRRTSCRRPGQGRSSTSSRLTSSWQTRGSTPHSSCGCSRSCSRTCPVGDLEKPKLVFFFDEAHLLFGDAPKALLERVEQVVRLIRSKGVGVYFVTQNPLDIPDKVLGQLGNRVQHALRAFTPRDQKAVKAAAETMRANPALDVEKAITELAVGEALVSLLDEQRAAGRGRACSDLPPASRIGPIAPEARAGDHRRLGGGRALRAGGRPGVRVREAPRAHGAQARRGARFEGSAGDPAESAEGWATCCATSCSAHRSPRGPPGGRHRVGRQECGTPGRPGDHARRPRLCPRWLAPPLPLGAPGSATPRGTGSTAPCSHTTALSIPGRVSGEML